MMKSSLFLRTTALAILLGGAAIVPALAQDADAPPPPPQNAPADQGDMAPPAPPAAGKHGMMGKGEHEHMDVEARVKTLHDKLMITPSQEKDWNNVAQTMRDNDASMHKLVEARHENKTSMTALDDLESYQQIAQAHADGAGKMRDAFKTLYNDMSDAEKKNADQVFASFEGHHGWHKHDKK